jgi:hypothetical protein
MLGVMRRDPPRRLPHVVTVVGLEAH